MHNASVVVLPRRIDIITGFGLFKGLCCPEVLAFSGYKLCGSVRMSTLHGLNLCMHPQVGSSGTLSCKCSACSRWKAYVKGELPGGPSWRQYEVWTQCYVHALATYLRHVRQSRMLSPFN